MGAVGLHFTPDGHIATMTNDGTAMDLATSPEQIVQEVESLVATLSAPATMVTGRIVAAMAEDARNQLETKGYPAQIPGERSSSGW